MTADEIVTPNSPAFAGPSEWTRVDTNLLDRRNLHKAHDPRAIRS